MYTAFKIALLAVGLSLLALNAQAAEEKEKEEVVAFSSLPAPVQATFMKEADGQKIEQVEKETENGKVVYEASVKLNDKNYEIEVAEDGTLLCKELEEEGDKEDDDDDEEDDDDDEEDDDDDEDDDDKKEEKQ